MADIVSISALVNDALDKSYNKTAQKVLAQIDMLTNSPTSQLQRALAELDLEADRLEKENKRMTSDNLQLLKTLDVIEQTYTMVAALIQANDEAVQASGTGLAIPAVTAKVFVALSAELIGQQKDPLSPQALAFYVETLQRLNIPWRIP